MDNPNETFKSKRDEELATRPQLMALDCLIKALETSYVDVAFAALGYVPPVKQLTLDEAKKVLEHGTNTYNNKKLLLND